MLWDPNQRSTPNQFSAVQHEPFLTIVLEELLSTEKSLRNKDRELAALLKDDSTRLGTILETRRDQSDLNSYLKGLKFRTEVHPQLVQPPLNV
jgi:hypothetical protein